MLKRWIKTLLKVLLGLFVLLVVFLLFERVRGQISLAHYKRELISKGEKLSAKDLTTTTNVGENGVPEIMEAIKQLKDGRILPGDYPPVMSLTPSGHAVIGFREDEWIGFSSDPSFHKTTNDWAGLAAELKNNEATLKRIRAALNKPVLNNNLDLSQGPKLRLLHLAPVKLLTYWFGAKAQLALHEGNTHEAADDLATELQLPLLLLDDNLLISELVRIAIMAIDRAAIWEALQADGWSDEDLARLQEACRKSEFISAMAHALEGERVYEDVAYDLCRKSNDETFSILEWQSAFSRNEADEPSFWEKTVQAFPYGEAIKNFFKKQVYCRIWRFAWSHQDQRRSLERIQGLIEITRKAAKAKSYSAVLADVDRITGQYDKKNWYDKLRYPGESIFPLVRCINKAMRVETERSQLLCAITLKRYWLRHGKFPTTLNELVPEFFAAIPTDYMDGKPMNYRLNADGRFTLYSVGEDGKDDDGDNTRLQESNHSKDLWRRKDVVWPLPATPEEIEAWRKEAAKN